MRLPFEFVSGALLSFGEMDPGNFRKVSSGFRMNESLAIGGSSSPHICALPTKN